MRYDADMTRRGVLFSALILLGAALWLIVVWPMSPGSQPVQPAAWLTAGQGDPPPVRLPDTPRPSPAPAAAVSVNALTAEPQPAEAPAAAEPQPSAAPPPSPELFAEPLGPVEEYKQRYAKEPRDSAASEAESLISAAFKPSDTRETLLRNVLCRETVCRLELSLSQAELGAYVAAMTRISQDFDREFGVNPLPSSKNDATRAVEVFVKRTKPQP